MIDITVNSNERSWEINLISSINRFADKNDLIVNNAGGESTISTGKHKFRYRKCSAGK